MKQLGWLVLVVAVSAGAAVAQDRVTVVTENVQPVNVYFDSCQAQKEMAQAQANYLWRSCSGKPLFERIACYWNAAWIERDASRDYARCRQGRGHEDRRPGH